MHVTIKDTTTDNGSGGLLGDMSLSWKWQNGTAARVTSQADVNSFGESCMYNLLALHNHNSNFFQGVLLPPPPSLSTTVAAPMLHKTPPIMYPMTILPSPIPRPRTLPKHSAREYTTVL